MLDSENQHACDLDEYLQLADLTELYAEWETALTNYY
jgi:hypothetical protein